MRERLLCPERCIIRCILKHRALTSCPPYLGIVYMITIALSSCQSVTPNEFDSSLLGSQRQVIPQVYKKKHSKSTIPSACERITIDPLPIE